MYRIKRSELRFLAYLAVIVYPKYDGYCFVLYMLYRYVDVRKQQQLWTIKSLSQGEFDQVLGWSEACDSNYTVILNKRFRSKFATLIHKDCNRDTVQRRVYVVTKHFEGKHNTVLINDTLMHNMKNASQCHLKPCHESLLQLSDEVDVALINSPYDWTNHIVDEIVKHYFKFPKFVCAGDVIRICCKQYGREMFYSNNKMTNMEAVLYLKCNTVLFKGKGVKSGYLCILGKSTLKQCTNVQGFVPPIIADSCHSGLRKYIEALERAVKPFIIINKKVAAFKPVFMLQGKKGSGKSIIAKTLAKKFGMHLYIINNFDVSANVYAQNETKMKNVLFAAKMGAPCVVEIRNFESFGKNNDGHFDERLITYFINEIDNLFRNNEFPIVILCCSNDRSTPVSLRRVFLKVFDITPPSEDERKEIIESDLLSRDHCDFQINLDDVAKQTNGFLFKDLKALGEYGLSRYLRERNEKPTANVSLSAGHFKKALDFMHSNYNESLGAPKIPKVRWSDVGGLNDVKEEIIKSIKLPLKHPKLLKLTGLKRSGILLYGPPGTGKTLIAKAVATECNLCFLSIKGPELLNMYVGQSEQNVREIFEKARQATPCIIFFDELDSLAPNRGASGDSGGVMDRVVSQLLAEMDGLNETGNIFIIGATNRPDLIDPSLLRPGRFDKLLFVGPCTDKDSKISVLTALTKKFNFESTLHVADIVQLCPETLSGADFYGLCTNAWALAVRRLITDNQKSSGTSAKSLTLKDVIVTLEDFRSAIRAVKPSIKQEDLAYFNKLNSELQ